MSGMDRKMCAVTILHKSWHSAVPYGQMMLEINFKLEPSETNLEPLETKLEPLEIKMEPL